MRKPLENARGYHIGLINASIKIKYSRRFNINCNITQTECPSTVTEQSSAGRGYAIESYARY